MPRRPTVLVVASLASMLVFAPRVARACTMNCDAILDLAGQEIPSVASVAAPLDAPVAGSFRLFDGNGVELPLRVSGAGQQMRLLFDAPLPAGEYKVVYPDRCVREREISSPFRVRAAPAGLPAELGTMIVGSHYEAAFAARESSCGPEAAEPDRVETTVVFHPSPELGAMGAAGSMRASVTFADGRVTRSDELVVRSAAYQRGGLHVTTSCAAGEPRLQTFRVVVEAQVGDAVATVAEQTVTTMCPEGSAENPTPRGCAVAPAPALAPKGLGLVACVLAAALGRRRRRSR